MTLRATELVPYRTLLRAEAAIGAPSIGPFLPGQTLTIRTTPALPYRVSINGLGFRGLEISRSKTPGTIRIVAIGGSHTFGLYVDGDETWPARLEAYLRGDYPDLGIEVINAGVDGLSLTATASLLHERILGLEPDLVILGHSLDSILAPESSATDLEPRGRLWSPLRHTATVNLFRMVGSYIPGQDRSKLADPAFTTDLLERPDGAATSSLLDLYGRDLAEIKALLDEEGIPCFVLLFPAREQVARGTGEAIQQRVAAIHREIGIPAIDLLPAYRRYDRNGIKYFLLPADDHPSPRGYRRGARELSSALRPLLQRWEAAGAGGEAKASGGVS